MYELRCARRQRAAAGQVRRIGRSSRDTGVAALSATSQQPQQLSVSATEFIPSSLSSSSSTTTTAIVHQPSNSGSTLLEHNLDVDAGRPLSGGI